MKNSKKKSFILYADQEKHISMMTDVQAGQLLKAIYSYAADKTPPVLTDPFVVMAFSFISEQMDRDAQKYEDICEKRRAIGKKGGAPVGNSNASKTTNWLKKQPKQPDNDTETENDTDTVNATDTVTVTVNDNATVIDNEYDTDTVSPGMGDNNACAHSHPQKPELFVPPDINEINAYCTETGKPIDAQAFINYYQSIGWKVGRNPMIDWKAAVRQWRRRDEENGKIFSPSPLPLRKTSYDLEMIEQSSLDLYRDLSG